jgi:hypothetical protein
MKFKRRHGRFEQGCVLSESYTATDALPLILTACRHSLLPVCVFVTRDTVRHLRRFFFSENVFVNRVSTVYIYIYTLSTSCNCRSRK